MTAFLIIFGIAALWVAVAARAPVRPVLAVPRQGQHPQKGRRRAPKCSLCKGARRRQRLGSRTVHRIRRQVAASLARPAMRGTWQTTHSGGPVVLAAVAVVLALVVSEWMLARVWWILGGTVLCVAVTAAAVVLLMRWTDCREARFAASRAVLLARESAPMREPLTDSGRAALGFRDLHIHAADPAEVATIIRTAIEMNQP